ncbi:DUF4136 domain-containing protein [Undibacterium sp. Jales W-56]|uniref:DUF4136 domain-containing protein n=1 Tax=Undibacterium sp. Jales W-56 TaxID=2897325 RepID=UPI0021D0C641|nr:DUF4136 domain-containing protein [Undibacterium sp. Jales W-56]MCU6435762.1 DUF4136 domain-containing protein [Undibacterium sp. Jales W-56]
MKITHRYCYAIFLFCYGLLLSGCATTVGSRVSVFHEWPAELKNKSFVVDKSEQQQNSPEFKAYELLLREKLKGIGLLEADTANQAHAALSVSMHYASNLSEIQLSSPWNLALYDPFWRLHFNRGWLPHSYFYRRPYFYYPYYSIAPDSMFLSDISVRRYFLHQLEVTIADKASGKKLTEIKASTEQLNPEIHTYMHYLMDSAFLNFPGTSGTTVDVELPLEK